MQLPAELSEAIEDEASGHPLSLLHAASESISSGYRAPRVQGARLIASQNDRIAYLIARLPATYASARRVAAEIIARIPGVEIQSLLDLGSGPGTAAWAATESFTTLQKITMVERDSHFIDLGKRLARRSSHPALREADWANADISILDDFPVHDAVFLSYVIGELPPVSVKRIIGKAWAAARKVIAIIEPGTPSAFSSILVARRELIALGARIGAPCPHDADCPMSGGDWCHFSERVERTALHRRAKSGALGYEDEKYSYVVAAHFDVQKSRARILRHPMKLKAHVRLELCTTGGLVQKVVSRKNKEQYRLARKTDWGSAWPFDDD